MGVTRRKSLVTCLLLSALLLAVLWRQNKWDPRAAISAALRPKPAEEPEMGVYHMLDAARAGDARSYLDCFSGDIQNQIAQVVKESSRNQFQHYLTAQNRAFTGVAVTTLARPTADTAQVRIEYVFPSRNEVQELYVQRQGSTWKITKVLGSEQIHTLIPYGTAVTD